MKATETFLLGTSVKITAILDRASPDSVKITIKDSSDIIKVNSASMTLETDNIYSYVYQSNSADNDGDYEATIEAQYGTYTSVQQMFFEMIEQ